LDTEHRGRIQVQGRDVNGDPSYPWARSTPLPRSMALAGLGTLRDACSREQLRRRDEAFDRAERFIRAGCVEAVAPVCRSFQNRNLPREHRHARVDVDIFRGIAFV
jgi:hypothetical protein